MPNSLIDISISYSSLFSLKGNEIEAKSVEFNVLDNGLYLENDINKYLCLVDVEDKNCNQFEISKDTKFINEYAFVYCNNLKEINIPNSVTKIAKYTFYNSGIEKINMHNNIKQIDDRAFAYSKLEEIKLPDKLEILGYELFAGTNIKKLDIPSSVEYINGSFINMVNVEEIDISNNNSYISSGAFKNCYNLKKTNIA